MRTNLWLVIVIVSAFIGFLLGYGISGYTGVQQRGGDYSLETGGYGDESGDADAGGYGGGEAGGYGGGGESGQGLDKETAEYYKKLGQETE